jgi:hypothetical protein
MTTAMQIGETARDRADFCRCFKTGAAVFLHDDGIVGHSTYRNTLIWKQIVEDSSTEEVMDVAEKAGAHPAIAAGRWRYEHSDYRRFSKLIGRGEVKSVLKSA